MTGTRDGYELRRRAIELHREGVGFEVILERLGRVRSWLSKWLHRYRDEGWAGLRPRSRAPKRQTWRTPERVVARVVEIREAVEFTAALYSLGVPPELIGTGRGLRQAKASGLLEPLEVCARSLRDELRNAGRYFSRPSLVRLAREQQAWAGVLEDVSALDDYLEGPLGPQTSEDEAHAEACAEFLAALRAGAPSVAALDTAARIRRSLG